MTGEYWLLLDVVVWCVLFVVRFVVRDCPLFVVLVFCVLLIVCRALRTVRWLFCVAGCLSCVARCFGVRRLLFVVYWLLVLDRCLLFVVYWLLICACGCWSLLLVALFVLDVCRCGLLCAGCRQLFVVCCLLPFVVVVDYCRSLLLVVACC